ncbi:STP1 protein [Plasmodium ovale wallikeri]|uniref:STP1 protein n=1 Tax=Plasmodium ovale wallikeri TaxID=864142 RepID=A0A1A9AR58_PLAOA|nr:STP1 protein [Plasmodium ovale wallikeri]
MTGADGYYSEWRKKKNGFLKKLFKEEGFIYTCDSNKNANNPSLNQLLSKHIQFCKEKDERLSDLGKNPEYDACRQYNIWINGKTTSFTREYLENVRDFERPTVHKYFSTKEHPGGHDPLEAYRNIKLNCNLYKSPSKNHQQKQVDNTPTRSLHPQTAPGVKKESRGKGESSMPDRSGRIEKTKFNVKQPPKNEPPASNSQTPSLTNTNVDGTANGQHDDLEAKGTGLPNNAQDSTGKPTGATNAKAPSFQQVPEPPSLISPQDSLAATVPNPPLSVIKGQDTDSNATPITTSDTSGTTHSIQNAASPSAPDFSLTQHQPTAVAADTDEYSKESTPDPVSKSPDQDVSLTSLDSGLAPSQAPTSNSSASETSTTISTTMVSTPGSSPAQDSHLLTHSTQQVVTTSIDTTLNQTTTSMSGPPTITVSAMSTNPIQSIIVIKSTTGESREPNTLPKSIANSQDLNSASLKNQNNPLPSNTGDNFPDTPSSSASANLNNIPIPDPSSDQPLLSPVPSPGLPSGVFLGGQAPVLPASHGVVTKPGGNKIKASTKDVPKQSRDSTQDTSTPLSEGTQPSGKPSITPTKFPPLTSIIPTIVIILATITLLFLLYKYTPFGLLLGRRRKRKKRDLRSEFVIHEESTYESPNIALHEWEDHNFVGQTVENDVYSKLLKINRYKQEMQKRKKKNKKTLIEVHMEVVEEYKNNEWELHKGDFLEICLRGFINDENDFYSNFPNSKLTINNINEKTIEDIQKQEILWNNWIENHRNILEQWKKEEWFHILKNKWRKEEQKYKEQNDKLQENILNEQETHSIVSQKEIWKQWISKQVTLIKMFNQEDCFKALVDEQNREKDNYGVNKYNDNTIVTNINGSENENSCHKPYERKKIIEKLMVQIHMMVLEECIKDEIIRNKELSIDNFIEDIHNQNNYDEKKNIPQCHTDDFNVLKYKEIHTSKK